VIDRGFVYHLLIRYHVHRPVVPARADVVTDGGPPLGKLNDGLFVDFCFKFVTSILFRVEPSRLTALSRNEVPRSGKIQRFKDSPLFFSLYKRPLFALKGVSLFTRTLDFYFFSYFCLNIPGVS